MSHDTTTPLRDAVGLRSVDPADENRVVVEWLLSSVCNYACSYCPKDLHDGKLGWLPWEPMELFCRHVAAHYTGRDLTFLFTGGEPTVYKRFLDLASLVRSLGADVAVLSNGSRTLGWWDRAAAALDEVILSYHCESADRSHFVAVAKLLASRLRLQVNVVMTPEQFDECLSIAQELEEVAPSAQVHHKPLTERWTRVHRYKTAVHAELAAVNARPTSSPPRATVLKGDLVREFADGSTESTTAIRLLLEGQNQWEGWECSIGTDSLFIRHDHVMRSACGVGGTLGCVQHLPPLPTEGIICTSGSCNCIAGIKASKWTAGRGRAESNAEAAD